jgi:glyoxylase-like metal-dependent hydrolase (beta-lactamase superfamily II)
MTKRKRSSFKDVVPGVARFSSVFANLYAVEVSAEGCQRAVVLVDTGLPLTAGKIRQAFRKHYGPEAKPRAIVLTHGHFDHAGGAPHLAAAWDIPVYAHNLELPYLTHRSHYPPPDPTIGGAMGLLSRFMPRRRVDLNGRLRALPADGSVPEMPGWRWIHTPGHTPGHVSLFRESDRVLICGDALTTVNQDSALAMLTRKRELQPPPRPFTTDWQQARRSVEFLALLLPRVIAPGHGLPLAVAGLDERLRDFAMHFRPPRGGRYVRRPASADATGVRQVPPPVPDLLPKIAAGAAVGAFALGAFTWWWHRRAA